MPCEAGDAFDGSMLRRLAVVTGVLLLAAGIVAGLMLGRLASSFGGRPAINTPAMLLQVQSLSELVTVKYVIEKVVILEDVKPWPGGENRVLLVAHGVVKAGVNLAELKSSDFSTNGNRLEVRLPQPRITDTYLDESRTQVIERNTGLLRHFDNADKDMEQTARRQAVDDIRRAARSNGILDEAASRARAQVRELLLRSGHAEVEVK